AEAPGREAQIRLKQTLELDQGLLVENHRIEIAHPAVAMLKAVSNGMPGKPSVVLLAREALLLSGGGHLAVDDDCGGAVVVKRRDPQDTHLCDPDPAQNSV